MGYYMQHPLHSFVIVTEFKYYGMIYRSGVCLSVVFQWETECSFEFCTLNVLNYTSTAWMKYCSFFQPRSKTNRWQGKRPDGRTVTFVRVGNKWSEYDGENHIKTFQHKQDIGSEAVMIQQPGLGPLILDGSSASYDGGKFASGGWV